MSLYVPENLILWHHLIWNNGKWFDGLLQLFLFFFSLLDILSTQQPTAMVDTGSQNKRKT